MNQPKAASQTTDKISFPLEALLATAVLSALIVGFSFYIMNYWPQPVSVAPYMGFSGGFWWGAVVGAISGLIIGFMTDDAHFN